MDDIIKKSISIPQDNDGYCLFQCHLCGNYFKMPPSEVNSDDLLTLWCPYCGLISPSYISGDIIDLSMNIAKNIAKDLVFDMLNSSFKNLNSNSLKVTVSKKPTYEPEEPVRQYINNLDLQYYKCCNKSAKIHPLEKIIGHFCPYCGVAYDENR